MLALRDSCHQQEQSGHVINDIWNTGRGHVSIPYLTGRTGLNDKTFAEEKDDEYAEKQTENNDDP